MRVTFGLLAFGAGYELQRSGVVTWYEAVLVAALLFVLLRSARSAKAMREDDQRIVRSATSRTAGDIARQRERMSVARGEPEVVRSERGGVAVNSPGS